MKKTHEPAEIVSFNLGEFQIPEITELSEMDLGQVTGGAPANTDARYCEILVCAGVVCGVLTCGTFGAEPI